MPSKSLIKKSAKTTPKKTSKSKVGSSEIVETKKVSKKNKNKQSNEDVEYPDSDLEDYIKVNLDDGENKEDHANYQKEDLDDEDDDNHKEDHANHQKEDLDDEDHDNHQKEDLDDEDDDNHKEDLDDNKLGGDESPVEDAENNESPVEDDTENKLEENNSESDKESTSTKTSSKKKGKNIDYQNIPELEVVSNAIKERYEYKPLLRTEIVYVLPEDRITSEVMTKFEYCEVISIRAKQIENGASSFTNIGDLTDPIEIAKKEIADKKCPLDIIRMKTDKIAERWHVNEMAIPYD